ncbi:MAG: lysozyme [Verrucomicrobiota bacterium]|jgi:lysozyme
MHFLNKVIDLSHHNDDPINFKKIVGAGIVGVIHKISTGIDAPDLKHDARRKAAVGAGLLWGSYQFGTGVHSGEDQAKDFLSRINEGGADLLALDFERNQNADGTPGVNMTLAQAREFVQYIAAKTGRYPMIYGGDFLMESLGSHMDTALAQCPLWLAAYLTEGQLPTWNQATWASWTLWQYTGDGKGAEPHTVDGVKKPVERDYYIGTEEQLKESWSNNLRHRDVAVSIPNALGVLAPPARIAIALKDEAQGWAATFTMALHDSPNQLLHGILAIQGPTPADTYAWVATSGRKPWQGPDDLWKKKRGPVPPNPDTGVGNHIESVGYVGNVVPYSHRILPENVTDPVSGITRGAFRVHYDKGDDGSEGCIAIRQRADFNTFDQLMLRLNKQKIGKIPLKLIYA